MNPPPPLFRRVLVTRPHPFMSGPPLRNFTRFSKPDPTYSGSYPPLFGPPPFWVWTHFSYVLILPTALFRAWIHPFSGLYLLSFQAWTSSYGSFPIFWYDPPEITLLESILMIINQLLYGISPRKNSLKELAMNKE